MKKLNMILATFTLMAGLVIINVGMAESRDGEMNGYTVREFVDEDGDGFNDLAPDHDGDGIPNGQDEDYIRPEDGTGSHFGDANADDGDNSGNTFTRMYQWHGSSGSEFKGEGAQNGTCTQDGIRTINSYGPGDGTGNEGAGPGDGTGFGPGDGDGIGECDGSGPTGPKGQ